MVEDGFVNITPKSQVEEIKEEIKESYDADLLLAQKLQESMFEEDEMIRE